MHLIHGSSIPVTGGFLTDHRNDPGEKIAIPVEKRTAGMCTGEIFGSHRFTETGGIYYTDIWTKSKNHG